MNNTLSAGTSLKKSRYKVVEVNGFWRYQVYKRTWFGWKKIRGKDTLGDCEEIIRESVLATSGIYYDEQGTRV